MVPLRRPPPPNIQVNSNNAPPIPPPPRSAGMTRHQPTPRSLVPGHKPPYSSRRDVYPIDSPDTPGYYSGDRPDSAQRLLPPGQPRSNPYRQDDGFGSPAHSGYSSRRTSFSSDRGSRDSRAYSPGLFNDSRAPSRSGSEDEPINTQTVAEKYNIMPSASLLLFPEDVEKDDYLHNPDDEDRRECDIFTKRGFANIGGLILVTLGVLMLFIGYPVLTFIRKLETENDPCNGDPDCLNHGDLPLLQNIRQGLIDPDTPSSAKTKTAADGSTQLQLVFSDEFNTNGRTFYPGDDPYFAAVNIWYGVTGDLEWYDPDAITTNNGVLEIRMDAFQNHGLNYRSGMLQSWNQLCFQGGHLEASISLPGSGDVMGFWPGFWSMGNLGRPGYAASTDGLWPYSYDDVCDAGITPNQSQTDGISYLPGMRLPACTCSGQSHPNPGKSRSAPEIDVLEASAGPLDGKNIIGQVSQSFQVAPFDIWWYPDYDYTPVFDQQITSLNSYTGGPFQQALSAISNLNNDWYNGNSYQTYAYEYTPGSQGAITWFVGSEPTWSIDARAIRPNGNIGQRMLPNEPMAVVMNLGLANSFVAINWTGIGELLPATMRFDYIRLYQDPNSQSVTCDPENYPTTSYIQQYAKAYQDQNVTSWAQAGFSWPQNSFMDGCST